MMDHKSDILITSDICWDDEADVRFMSNNWKRIIYIDHHPESKNYVGKFDNVKIIFNADICSTMICYKEFLFNDEYVSKKLLKLIAIVNDYDTWNQDGKFFDTGFYLNILFFKYGFWDYTKRFIDGFTKFNEEEQNFIDEHKKNANNAIEALILESFYNDLVCLAFVDDCNYLNDVSIALRQWDYELSFIIYESHTSKARVSIRTNGNDEWDVEKISEQFRLFCVENDIELLSIGGHKAAGGIEFKESLEIMEIYKILKEFINEKYT